VVCPESQERANKWAVLALAGVAAFMTTLDASIVNISLPAIARAFEVALGGAVEWVITGYLVAIAAVLLTFGRLADMLGRKPILITGLVVFTLGSALCGAAPSLGVLIAARCFQGLGAALIFAVNIAMITQAFPAAERGRALGINAILVALGISVGPTVGGIITQQLTWRWIFYVNVPVGIAATLAALGILTERLHGGRERFDPVGAALLAVGLASLTLGLSFGQEWGWTSWRLIVAVVVGLAALIVVAPVERRVSAPLLDLALLRNRVFAAANVSFILCMLALFAVGFLLPFYFEELRGFDAQQAGLLLTPLSLTLAVVAPISGSLADRIGSRWLAPSGLAIACLGLLLLSQLTATSSTWDVIWRLAVTGIGQGLFQAPNTRTIMSAAPRNEQGVASGLLATGRVIGQSLSVALAGAVFATLGGAAAGSLLLNSRHSLSPARVSAEQQTFVGALHAAFVVCAAIAAAGIATSFIGGKRQAQDA
jgi:EmrB/QacA subfamily drug resistance transporter